MLTGRVCSQPHPRAEAHRHKVFQHVAKLIRHVAKIEEEEEVLVYRFGSVPLKTYLPHGDLDLTAFSADDKWLQLLKTRLEEQARAPTQFSCNTPCSWSPALQRGSLSSAADSPSCSPSPLHTAEAPAASQGQHAVHGLAIAAEPHFLSDSEVLRATLEAAVPPFCRRDLRGRRD